MILLEEKLCLLYSNSSQERVNYLIFEYLILERIVEAKVFVRRA